MSPDRPSKRFNAPQWQRWLIPFILAVLGVSLLALLVFVVLLLFGIVPG